MKPGREYLVYFVGIGVLGFAYVPLRAAIPSDALFVVVAVLYLGALRVIGQRVAVTARSQRHGASDRG